VFFFNSLKTGVLNIHGCKATGTNYLVDGYDNTTNAVYEAHGDYWHGNPKIYNLDEYNTVCNKTFGQLFKNTLHKELILKKMGYNYKCIWESEWNKGKMALIRLQRNFRYKMDKKKFPYQCEKCNFKSKYKHSYEKHLKTQLHITGNRKTRSDKKMKLCPHCKLYETIQKTNLTNHILNNHKSKEDRKQSYPYYCELCDYGSFSEKMYDNHLHTKKHSKKLVLSIKY
jgi:hypothetical protein